MFGEGIPQVISRLWGYPSFHCTQFCGSTILNRRIAYKVGGRSSLWNGIVRRLAKKHALVLQCSVQSWRIQFFSELNCTQSRESMFQHRRVAYKVVRLCSF